MIGVVCAHAWEAACLPRAARGLSVEVCGIGSLAARRAAEVLIADGVRALLAFGSAGGLAPGLRAGDLSVPETILDGQGRLFRADPFWRRDFIARIEGAGARIFHGPLLQVSEVLVSPERKTVCRDAARSGFDDGPEAVDMESASVAAVAQAAGTPFLAVRAVLDAADRGIPAALLSAVDDKGRPLPWRLARALIRRPFLLGECVTLARARARAARTLHLVGPALCPVGQGVPGSA